MFDPAIGRFEYSYAERAFYLRWHCRECGRKQHRLCPPAECPACFTHLSGTFSIQPESCPDCQAKAADRIADELLATL
jgi:hypothetical protein